MKLPKVTKIKNDNFGLYLRSVRILTSESVTFWALLLSGIVVAVIQIYEPIMFGKVIDSLSSSSAAEKSFRILATWACLGIVNVVSSVYLGVMADRLAHRQRLNILGEIFERVIGLPIAFHSERGSGKVVRAILSGSDQLFSLWIAFLREHLVSLVGILVLIPIALKMDYRMAILLSGLAVIYSIANYAILNKTHSGQTKVENFHQDVFGRVGDVIGNVPVVQAYARLIDESAALQSLMARLLREQYPVLTWWGILSVVTRLAATLTMILILALGSVLAVRKQISVGEIVAFVGFSGILISKLDQVSSFLSRMVTQAPALRNFFELFDRGVSAIELPGAQVMKPFSKCIEFNNVSFSYPNGKQGLRNISFSVPHGQTVALVGASGSGKTTTLALLQRVFDPQSGQITIDGTDIRELTIASLRAHIATVFQDAGLFNRSIKENILVGRATASDADIVAAAKRADAHDFISQKLGDYDFVIGEWGSALSGGERQRIAIARAILKHAPILIFDEATSALDNETERKIQRAINDLRSTSTTFIIAHRLSTIIDADLILFFENGQIVESGSYDELRKLNDRFARLLEAGKLTPKHEPQSEQTLTI